MKKQSIFFLDFLRVISILAVIIIHVTAQYFVYYKIDSTNWTIANIYEALSRWSVPIFIMISGYLLLGKNEEIVYFFRKRTTRILIPLLFWGVFYIAFFYRGLSLKTMLIFLIQGAPDAYHLWYLYTLLGLYLITPVLRVFISNAPKANFLLFIFLCFLYGTVYPLIRLLFGINIGVNLTFVSGYLGYYLLGYYLRIYPLNNICKKYLFILAFPAASITVYGTYYLSHKNNVFKSDFYEYLSLNVVIFSVAIFVLFQTLKLKKIHSSFFRNFILSVSQSSFGIYLIHVFVLETWKRTIKLPLVSSPLMVIPIVSLICFGISYGLVLLIEKIPMVRKII